MEDEIKMETGQGDQVNQTALNTCQEELATAKNKLLRLTADFENIRKNTEKELVRSRLMAQVPILIDLLAIVDDFDNAFADLAKHTEKKDVHYAGFELMYKALHKMLTKYGVEEITENTVFDPMLHEAVMQVTQEGVEPGTIVQVLQKGYRYKGMILRPAKVSVAQ
ncbi:MAG: nucleotide exchange factor GrpE [Candidatus Babeliaceae bacterium]